MKINKIIITRGQDNRDFMEMRERFIIQHEEENGQRLVVGVFQGPAETPHTNEPINHLTAEIMQALEKHGFKIL